MMVESKVYYQSPIGLLEITGVGEGVKSILFIEREMGETYTNSQDIFPVLVDCVTQLDEYFAGKRKGFSLPLAPEGTDFQKSVWQALGNIPYGETVSYLDIAKALDNKNAIRAVGAANGQNPIVIVIPCHRVIGSDGSLTGYGGGLWRKEWLLNHEGWHRGGQLPLF